MGGGGLQAEEGFAVGFGDYAVIEENDKPFVFGCADQASHALSEFEHGLGHGVVDKGVAAIDFDGFEPGRH